MRAGESALSTRTGGCARQPELVQHLLRDLAWRADFSVQEHVGLLVEWSAFGQQTADSFQRLSLFQKRTMVLIFHALVNGFRPRPEANDERMLLETRHVLRIYHEAAAGGNHSATAQHKFFHDFFFLLAKRRFALLRKN